MTESQPGTLILQPTADGSFTFFSQEFGEAFHSHFGARQEAIGKFVIPTQLAQRASQGSLKLLDVCYGLSYNSAAALETIFQVNPHCQIELIGLEINPQVPRAAIAQGLLRDWSASVQQVLASLATEGSFTRDRVQAQLLWGDARQTIQQVSQSGFQADAIFLDPFSPPHCPQLWTVEFLAQVSHCLAPTGRLATYSCSAAVRTALHLAGLNLGSTTPVGRRSPGTVACWTAMDLPPLSLPELEHLQTCAAVPYRDPELSDTAESMINRRRQEQQTSGFASTSKWRKRWQTIGSQA